MFENVCLIEIFHKEEFFDYEKHEEVKSPENEVPCCTVPEPGKRPYNKDVENAKEFVKKDLYDEETMAKTIYADRLMEKLAEEYPMYGIAKHKGYPTPDHKLAVYEYGPSPIHRKSFLSFLERDKEKLEAALAEKRAKETE